MEKTKFIASQAKSIYHYKSLRYRILKCNADISFNKQCLAKKVIPNYATNKALIDLKLVPCVTETCRLKDTL